MKRIKYFVLSLLVCFSFGCTESESAKNELKLLIKNIDFVGEYHCVRLDIDENYVCTLFSDDKTLLVRCSSHQCYFIECNNDTFCFQSNDTE